KIQVVELWLDKKNPGEIKLSEEINFNDKSILLIDDVANSGRTMLYALKPLLQHKPKQIETLALVERTHKKFPIAVDYIGLSISTSLQEHIIVDVENGEIAGARME
nr:phosphoribosyltransferase [Ferruginibacter sp.]